MKALFTIPQKHSRERIWFRRSNSPIKALMYRTLYSCNLIWVVCHLFLQQRWRTHTNNQSRETIGQENHVTYVKLRLRKFRPEFIRADSKTRIFYKYVIFKHSFSFSQFSLQRWHTLSSVWHSSYSPTRVKSKKKWISLADIHFFHIHWLWDFFQSRKNRLFRTTKRNGHFK